MKKFLTKIFNAVLGISPAPIPARATPQALPPVTNEELQSLNEKWATTPFIQLGDFMKALNAQTKNMPRTENPLDSGGSVYFTTLSRFQSRMQRGEIGFFLPRPGVYNYPEQDMFFPEHCYVHIGDLVHMAQKSRDAGDLRRTHAFIAALKQAAETSAPHNGTQLVDTKYLYEDGKSARDRYYSSAYEAGGSFALVLRHRDGGNAARLRQSTTGPSLPKP
ncbi:hypothetical protein [Micavibrio aeruginosavorus]|uniref:hypothetical protein n=1 Tax=Micavibrio aeruginosavorus TaxID=349221 RepID=UPI003F4A980C